MLIGDMFYWHLNLDKRLFRTVSFDRGIRCPRAMLDPDTTRNRDPNGVSRWVCTNGAGEVRVLAGENVLRAAGMANLRVEDWINSGNGLTAEEARAKLADIEALRVAHEDDRFEEHGHAAYGEDDD